MCYSGICPHEDIYGECMLPLGEERCPLPEDELEANQEEYYRNREIEEAEMEDQMRADMHDSDIDLDEFWPDDDNECDGQDEGDW